MNGLELLVYLSAALCVGASFAGYPVAVFGLLGLVLVGCARGRS